MASVFDPALRFYIAVILVLHITKSTAQCPNTVCDCSSYITHAEITCSHRDLTSIPQNLPANTRTLRLDHNMITSIDAHDLSGLISLKRLVLYNNMISFINPQAFHSQSNLEYLQLQNNKISSLHPQTFWGLGKLEELNLENNELVTLQNGTFDDLGKLVELTLNGNPLETLPGKVFENLGNLHTLDLSETSLGMIPDTLFDGLRDLRTLRLDHIGHYGNLFSNSSNLFSSTLNLTHLQVRRNSLSCIPTSFSVLTSLETLDLEQNPLTCNDFSALKHFPALITLNLDRTNVTSLQSRMFQHNNNLLYLYVTETTLSVIENNAFVGLNSLDRLYLYSNNLTTIPHNVFSPLPSSVNLDISDNPFHCDCNLRWLREWLVNTHTGVVADEYQPMCVFPDLLNDHKIVNIEESNFACAPEVREGVSTEVEYAVWQGDDLRLECPITGDPNPSLHWLTPDHTELLPDTNVSPYSVSADSVLTIVRIQMEDAGTYSCEGTNFAGATSIRNIVTVQEPADNQTPAHSGTTQSTGTTQTARNDAIKAGPGSSVIIASVCVVGVVIGLVAISIAVFMCRRRSRRTPRNDEIGMVIINEPVGNGHRPCNEGGFQPTSFAPFDRYIGAVHGPVRDVPLPSEKPPPYSVSLPPCGEEIYDHIEDNHYYDMRGPADSPALNHTYIVNLRRQDSQASCGAPTGYDRFLPHQAHTPSPTNDYITSPLSQMAAHSGAPGPSTVMGPSSKGEVCNGNTVSIDSAESLPEKKKPLPETETVNLQMKTDKGDAMYVNARR
ncbi:uncharacterized protein [Diadema antillarum]|uniref:uncharacterized protein n=1 Tax=Diadema antillarum TaxID=105358 RepID=UPI003A839902